MFKPTEEQEAIFHSIIHDNSNLLVEAFAGCGKSTTIIEAINRLIQYHSDCKLSIDENENQSTSNEKKVAITVVAFNKHIRDEMKTKLPEGVMCSTLHGIGYGAILRRHKDIKMDNFKVDNHLKKKLKIWNIDSEFKKEGEKERYIKAIKEMVNLCRLTLTTDKSFVIKLADKYDIKPISSNTDARRILQVLESMTNDVKTFDYTDMIYLPAVDNKMFLFPADYLIVEECQDISKAQQKMIDKMIKRDRKTGKVIGKAIFVGDNFQSIYGFTGVSDKSFEWFKNFPNTKTLPLSYSFRCSKSIIDRANKIVPNIKALPTAGEGIVRVGDVLLEADNNDFVLCRTTAPLIKLFFYYISNGKKATIVGSDIGISLIEMLIDFNDINSMLIHWVNELENLKISLQSRGLEDVYEDGGYVSLDDKVTTLAFISKYATSIIDLKEKISKIFTDDKENRGIILSTIHKSKGLEANRVFIVRMDLLPLKSSMSRPWLREQESHLEYVAITRARNELIFDFNWGIDKK